MAAYVRRVGPGWWASGDVHPWQAGRGRRVEGVAARRSDERGDEFGGPLEVGPRAQGVAAHLSE
jgi:hypothetical protein